MTYTATCFITFYSIRFYNI